MNRTHSSLAHAVLLVFVLLMLVALTVHPAKAATATPVAFAKDLTMGAKGTDVVALQTWLVGKGFSIPAGATGVFGGQTKAAVLSWQKANGITPRTGYFGPKSRSLANGMGSSTADAPAVLTGSGGYLANFSQLGDVEQLFSDGSDDTKVLGVSMIARGSDASIERVDVQFDLSGSSGSTDISRYLKSASVYLNGVKLGTMNVTDGSYQNKVWTLRLSNLHGLLKAGAAANLYVEVTPIDMVRSAEFEQNVKVSIPPNGIRAVDGAGVSSQYGSGYNATFRINDGYLGTLTLTEASDDPRASVVKADTSNTTTNLTLLAFNGTTKYESTTIKTLPIELSVTGTTNVSDVVQSVALMKGSTVLSTKTITATGSTATVSFTNLSEAIDTGASQEYRVVATIRKVGTGASASAFDSGDTVQASILSTDPWDASDDTGYQTEMHSSVTAGIITFQADGITVAETAATATKSLGTTAGSGDTTQYAIAFTLTAGDSDLYLARTTLRSLAPSTTALTWATTTSSTANATNLGVASLTAADSNSSDTGSVYKIPAGATRTFTANVVLTATNTGFSGVVLTGLAYGTTTTPNTAYASGLDQFKTQDISMIKH